MRRPLAAVAAILAVASVASPASARDGDIVFTAPAGATYAVLDLPDLVRVSASSLTVTTNGRYAVLLVTQDKRVWGDALRHPDGSVESEVAELPEGRSTVRVLSEAPVTFRLRRRDPGPGISLRADRRLAGAVATVRTVAPSATGEVRDDIAFRAGTASYVVHDIVQPYDGVGVGQAAWFCVERSEEDCYSTPSLSAGPAVTPSTQYWHERYNAWPYQGGAHAYYRSVDAVLRPLPATHYLLSVPILA